MKRRVMPPILHVPDDNIISSKALSNEVGNMPHILQGPDENILSISSFLSVQDIRCLASTCRSLRDTLIASHGATTCIWARRIQETFPEVFRHANARISGPINDINLSLLTHLLPQRYPHSIDPSTLTSDIGPRSFRSFEAKSSIFPKLGTEVLLIKFEGQVGTGNRSLRADQPFPPGCNRKSQSVRKKNRLITKLKEMTPFKLKVNGDRRENDFTTLHGLRIFTDHFSQASVSRDYLLPFVIPTVISDTSSSGRNEDIRLLIDLTPRFVAYFEVTIIGQAHNFMSPENTHNDLRHECVSIGLSTTSFCPQGKMPGWDFASYGYHSDDGGMFHGTGIPPRHGRPPYGRGDIVGCGLEYLSRRIFFTKNGKFLGYQFGNIGKDVVESGLYPTVGVDSECPIFVNFGEQPFNFDLEDIEVQVSHRQSVIA